jgi:hypothetical protein
MLRIDQITTAKDTGIIPTAQATVAMTNPRVPLQQSWADVKY